METASERARERESERARERESERARERESEVGWEAWGVGEPAHERERCTGRGRVGATVGGGGGGSPPIQTRAVVGTQMISRHSAQGTIRGTLEAIRATMARAFRSNFAGCNECVGVHCGVAHDERAPVNLVCLLPRSCLKEVNNRFEVLKGLAGRLLAGNRSLQRTRCFLFPKGFVHDDRVRCE
jgi:hypothetical protein